jgi:parallel beta-helix repeat protein
MRNSGIWIRWVAVQTIAEIIDCYTHHNIVSGIVTTSTFCTRLSKNISRFNGDAGISCSSDGGIIISDNEVVQNTGSGIYMVACYYCNVSGNEARYNSSIGIYINGCGVVNLEDNDADANGLDGIRLNDSGTCNVVGNSAINNANNWDGIRITGASVRNTITGNNCQSTAPGNQEWGINITGPTAVKNVLSGNICYGNDSGQIQDLGTGTQWGHNITS